MMTPQTPNRFDRVAKDVLRASLEPDGLFESDAEASPAGQHVDGWFLPDASRPPSRERFGLLGRLARGACTFEPFHATPGPELVSECVRKTLNFRHVRESAPEAFGSQQAARPTV